MEEKKELTPEELQQSEQLKQYLQAYKKAHTPWRRVDIKRADANMLGEEAPLYKKLGRNDKCGCSSGKKLKNCCGSETRYYLAK